MHKMPGKQLNDLNIHLSSLVSTMSVGWFSSFLKGCSHEGICISCSTWSCEVKNNLKEVISGYREKTLKGTDLMFYSSDSQPFLPCGAHKLLKFCGTPKNMLIFCQTDKKKKKKV